MPEQNKPFVVTDRRKFTLEGEPRPDADPSPEKETHETAPATSPAAAPTQTTGPVAVPQAAPKTEADSVAQPEEELPAGPTADQSRQANDAYQATADRLDTAIRAANPGMDHQPPVSFDQIVQSIYLTALVQLGAHAPEGQQPRVDILGARQSIDMLGILAEKTKGNLNEDEFRLLDSALFELRMAFLEVTQALARSAAKAGAPGQPGPLGPSIVR
jgi:Domain of unknown function (DUF1844)